MNMTTNNVNLIKNFLIRFRNLIKNDSEHSFEFTNTDSTHNTQIQIDNDKSVCIYQLFFKSPYETINKRLANNKLLIWQNSKFNYYTISITTVPTQLIRILKLNFDYIFKTKLKLHDNILIHTNLKNNSIHIKLDNKCIGAILNYDFLNKLEYYVYKSSNKEYIKNLILTIIRTLSKII